MQGIFLNMQSKHFFLGGKNLPLPVDPISIFLFQKEHSRLKQYIPALDYSFLCMWLHFLTLITPWGQRDKRDKI